MVFSRDIEVGRQDGHQLQIELDLKRQILKESEVKSVDSVSLRRQFYPDKSKKEQQITGQWRFHYLDLSPLKSKFTSMKMRHANIGPAHFHAMKIVLRWSQISITALRSAGEACRASTCLLRNRSSRLLSHADMEVEIPLRLQKSS